MPKIPEFERRQLASQAVGTPGVDNSGEMLGRSISQGSEQAFNAFAQMNKEREAVRTDMAAARAMFDLQKRAAQETFEHEKTYSNFSGDPAVRVKHHEEKMNSLFEETASSLPGDVRLKFEKDALPFLQNMTIREMKTAQENSMLVANSTFLDMANEAAIESSKLGGRNDVSLQEKTEMLLGFNASVNNGLEKAKRNLRPEDYLAGQKVARDNNLRGFIEGASFSNPEQVLAVLEDERFKDALDPKEREKYRQEALNSFDNLKERIETENMVNEAKTLPAIYAKYRTGDMSFVADLAEIRSPLGAKLRRAFLPKPDVVTAAATEARLNMKFAELEFSSDGKKLKDNMTEIMTFMSDVLDAGAGNNLSQEKQAEYIMVLVPPLVDRFQNRGFFNSPYSKVWKSVSDKFMKGKPAEQQVALFNNIMGILKSQEKAGTPITQESIASAIDSGFHEYQASRYPALYARKEGIPGAIYSSSNRLDTVAPGGGTEKAAAKVAGEATLMEFPDGSIRAVAKELQERAVKKGAKLYAKK